MNRSFELEPWEEDVLRLAANGLSLSDIAAQLGEKYGFNHKQLRDRLSLSTGTTYRKMGALNLVHACALFAHRLGARGEPLGEGSAAVGEQHFRLGDLTFPAKIVTSELRTDRDLACPLEQDEKPGAERDRRYEVPLELRERIEVLRKAYAEEALQRGEVVFERGENMFVVNRLEAENETFSPLRLRLRRAGYLTFKAINQLVETGNMPNKGFDPSIVVSPKYPLPIGVSVHVIAGDPPQLILTRRARTSSTYGGFFSAACQGWGEADQDVSITNNERRFDYVYAMWRELKEERKLGLTIGDFRKGLRPLGLVYNFREQSYDASGYIVLPGRSATQVAQALASAKEGIQNLTIDFPASPALSSRYAKYNGQPARVDVPLQAVCSHLRTQNWHPHTALSLFILLERLFSSGKLSDLLYESLGIPKTKQV